MDKKIILKEIPAPIKDALTPILINEKTIEERKHKVLAKMRNRGLDKLIVYCDVEHGYNFAYLVGFYTRFEEALLILDKDGNVKLLLGNENLNKVGKARVKAEVFHVSLFSLPNQPNRKDKDFNTILREAGICEKDKIGMVGWKNFTSCLENNSYMIEIPSFIVETIKSIIGKEGSVQNETSLYIGENGVRTINNANEIAHYEYGAALASDCMLDAMNKLEVGKSELEIADCLVRYGQHTNITTIAAIGERYIDGNMFPTSRKVQIGEPVSLSVGYAGGSSSRAGIAVSNENELTKPERNYLEEMAIPYYKAYVSWLENIKIGMKGKEMFNLIEDVLPRKEYGWSLCPGHLTADEEWLSSPIYENSEEIIKSGMIFQVDIIPSKKGMHGVNAESTVVLADALLKEKIKQEYPLMWDRMQKRKKYIKHVLHIELSEDVLPMCSTLAYLRPFMLDHKKALCVE